ncbi:hypothetical protein ABIC94_002114 [Variovorax paradoxus]|uniref:hypothetical protein n=1 Tax=Variovorax paradoxus TaxID=34073 RepID=UPI003398198B
MVAENINDLETVAPQVVDAFLGFRDEYWQRLSETALYLWLRAQPGFQRAISLTKPRRATGRSSLQEFRKFWIERFTDGTRDPILEVTVFFRHVVRNTWDERLVEALQRYLFQDHESLFRAKRDIVENCRKAKAAIQAVAPLFGKRTELPIANWIIVSQRELDRALLLYGSATVRNSKHKAEHAFVEDMWRINIFFFRTAKPAVIAELMTLPCFEHQFDLRHMSKLCSALNKAKSGRLKV